MSNDLVSVTFQDGTMHYGVGDSSELVSCRLYDSEEAAWNGYCNETIYEPIDPSTSVNDEAVHLETKYGTPNRSYMNMFAQFARASKRAKLITRSPSFQDPDHDPYR